MSVLDKRRFESMKLFLIVNSFLLDRLENPTLGLQEMYRVLRPQGRIMIITPLNFQQATHWQAYYPASRLLQHCKDIGFTIVEYQAALPLEEPLDHHGNKICWNCIALVLSK